MTEDELDLLLADAKREASAGAAVFSRLVAVEAVERANATPASRRWRRKGLLAPMAIGILALSGAGTFGAYQLSIPPFVGLEAGVERVLEPIALPYTTDAGTVVECTMYLEFTDVTEAQREALNSLGTDPIWRDFGQEVYDGLPAESRAIQSGPEEVWSARVEQRVVDEAVASAPGLQLRADDGMPSVHGWTIRCEYPQGQP